MSAHDRPAEAIAPPNGPECYRRAAGLLQQVATEDMEPATAAALVGVAQTYAALAQAAAVIDAMRGGTPVWEAWPGAGGSV